jgi:hypothetical protein
MVKCKGMEGTIPVVLVGIEEKHENSQYKAALQQ